MRLGVMIKMWKPATNLKKQNKRGKEEAKCFSLNDIVMK